MMTNFFINFFNNFFDDSDATCIFCEKKFICLHERRIVFAILLVSNVCTQRMCGTENVQHRNHCIYICVININKFKRIFTSVDWYYFICLHKCYAWSIFRISFEKLPFSQLLQAFFFVKFTGCCNHL